LAKAQRELEERLAKEGESVGAEDDEDNKDEEDDIAEEVERS